MTSGSSTFSLPPLTPYIPGWTQFTTLPLTSNSAKISLTISSASSIPSITVSNISSSAITSGTKTSASASPTPSVCGESGNFTLDWDDEPIFVPSDPRNAPFPPLFSPYHHFFFTNGYSYVPPPEDPFPPVSPPRLAMFIPSDQNQNVPGIHPGLLGAGPRAPIDAFWFNAYGAWFGCDYGLADPCTLRVSGYKYDAASKAEVISVQDNFTISSCPGFVDCKMEEVNFSAEYQGLSGLQMEMFVNQTVPRIWWMDDLEGAWWNNTCEAGLLRQRSRK